MPTIEGSTPAASSLFGRVRMGYLLAESSRLGEWAKFASEGLGLHVDHSDPRVVACRIDSHQRRLIIRHGAAEDVIAIGWQLDDAAALKLALARMSARGIQVEEGSKAEATLRGVDKFWFFAGPKKLRTELFTAPVLSDLPLHMKASGFVTGASGMGHVAVTTRQPEVMLRFWKEVFDARLSDEIEDKIDGLSLDFAFLRFNERHHSFATASTRGIRLNPLRTQIHHMNLQCLSIEDVTQAYLRCRAMGYPIANAIGQHPNDRELSFYVETPSGFEIELGWNPIVVDERTWRPSVYQGISLWGHRPENLSLGARLGRVRRALASLMQPEYSVQGEQS
ncbi:VOC family protein [Burkholderia pseudomultivorans]|uniref:Extradiol ring-cleavage dioxygenase n=1 Tax=Burkholderia pseudomultivorans TaxID=1207504 RepID=A0A132EFU7_9BURK|nr:VOC family protein [Burkholderia pseudomultivorans]KWF27845.1 extradiol ring-cleavage dioxygenase [Burkholderia pseudomultivorans]MBF5010627.1 VOC family protein [Burkholderia pseudomultivorans]